MTVKITLEELLEAGAHFGHQSRRWNPKMEEYLYGVKDGVHIFDLAKTKIAIEEALKVLEKYVSQGKSILLVGTKKQAKDRVKEIGEKTGISYIDERWLGGTLTNFNQIINSVRKLKDIEEGLATEKYNSYTKKERLLLEREVEKLKRNFGGLRNLTQKPDLMIIIDTHREEGAIKEARRFNVPMIGVTDSNADPTFIDWPIPMNDDASKSVAFILDLIEKTILLVNAKPEKDLKVKNKKTKLKANEKKEEADVAD